MWLSFKRCLSTGLLKLMIFLTIGFFVIIFLLFGPSGILHSRFIGDDRFIVIPYGSSLQEIGQLLDRENISSANSFMLATVLSGNRGKLKAGEYAVPTNVSPLQLAELIASGKTVTRKFTVVEGVSVAQIIQSLQENPVLKGEITRIPQEGHLMPDTYLYFYGDQRQVILDKMEKSMHTFLESLGDVYQQNPVIQNKKDLLTLASLVEKETALGAERPLVSSVYLNRLKINMPLQCDPTVIYAITQGKKLDRPLSKADLQIDSPYNTYRVKGLPQGPIACPGKESILAVLNPQPTQALYFVANGQGGHQFANNLNDHNVNVREWRSIQKQSRQEQLPKKQEVSPPCILKKDKLQPIKKKKKKQHH